MEKYDINKVYIQYKEFIASYTDLKALAGKIIEQRQLSPVMNDTKWLELQTAILSIPEFEPAYNIQLLTDNITYSPIFEQVPTYLGSWEFIYENYEYSLPPFFNIEWIAIQPLYAVRRGRLVEPEIIDKSSMLLDILHKFHIPFEKADEHTFVIYGYK